MSNSEILRKMSRVDPRAPITIKRLSRRKHRFSKESPHEWRRDERAASVGKDNSDKDNSYKGADRITSIDMVDLVPMVLDLRINPNYLGTNIILEDLGLKQDKRDLVVALYNKDVVKVGSRIAAYYARMHGIPEARSELPFLFDAVYWLGSDKVIDMVLEENQRPSDIMTRRWTDKIVSPRQGRLPLDVLAANVPVDVMRPLYSAELRPHAPIY